MANNKSPRVATNNRGQDTEGMTSVRYESTVCAVPECGRPRAERGWCHKHYNYWWKNGRLEPLSVAELFWAKVDKSGTCWVWRAATLNGYGYLHSRRDDEHEQYAHRRSWMMHFGPIPPGLYVCHRCDNRPCVRPDHLFLGTPRDNMRDMADKGRGANPALLYPERVQRGDTHWSHRNTALVRRGDQHHSARLTAEQVVSIRARMADGEHYAAIAAEYGLSKQTIHDILRRRTWRHI